MAKTDGSASMSKAGFSALLKENGYTLDTQSSGVPAVICDTADIGKVSKKIKELALEAGYPGSFGVRGNSVMPEPEPQAEPESTESSPVSDLQQDDDNGGDYNGQDDDYVQMSLFNM